MCPRAPRPDQNYPTRAKRANENPSASSRLTERRRSTASLHARQRGGDGTPEGLHGEGLLHEGPARLLDACHLVARHQNYFDPRPQPLYATGELSAIHERHDKVDQEQVESFWALADEAHGLQRIGRLHHGVALGFQDVRGERADLRIIVDDQDRGRGLRQRRGRGLTVGLGDRLIDVLTDEREGGALDLEDDGRAFHGDAAAGKETVRVDDLEKSAVPFRRGTLAQGQSPGRQLIAAADPFVRSDASGHSSERYVRIIDGGRASVKSKVSGAPVTAPSPSLPMLCKIGASVGAGVSWLRR